MIFSNNKFKLISFSKYKYNVILNVKTIWEM